MVRGAEQRRPFGGNPHGFAPHLERIASLLKGYLVGTCLKGRKRGGGKTAIQDDNASQVACPLSERIGQRHHLQPRSLWIVHTCATNRQVKVGVASDEA